MSASSKFIAVPNSADGKFALIPLEGGGAAFVFTYAFPVAPIAMSRHANWPEQDTTIGTKPLFYANRDPKKIEVSEVWLDQSDDSSSLTSQINALFALQDETALGTPPLLLALWGDRAEMCVLVDVRAEETFHAPEGWPIRVKVSLELEERQTGAS
ncbi:MAG TPA: hypothetical protein VI756_00930 [Blastocatellia bacterium]